MKSAWIFVKFDADWANIIYFTSFKFEWNLATFHSENFTKFSTPGTGWPKVNFDLTIGQGADCLIQIEPILFTLSLPNLSKFWHLFIPRISSPIETVLSYVRVKCELSSSKLWWPPLVIGTKNFSLLTTLEVSVNFFDNLSKF